MKRLHLLPTRTLGRGPGPGVVIPLQEIRGDGGITYGVVVAVRVTLEGRDRQLGVI